MAAPESPLQRRATSKQALLAQALLCVLCCLVGAFYSTLLNRYKTARDRRSSSIAPRSGGPFLAWMQSGKHHWTTKTAVRMHQSWRTRGQQLAYSITETKQQHLANQASVFKKLGSSESQLHRQKCSCQLQRLIDEGHARWDNRISV